MAMTRSIALVCSGPVSRSTVARLPGIREQLGWVKAPTFRMASRAANSLKSGVAVADYSALDRAHTILISVPMDVLHRHVQELLAAEITWRGKVVAVIETDCDSTVLRCFRSLGAHCATLTSVGGPEDRSVLIEGDSEAVRILRRFIGTNLPVLTIATATKKPFLDTVEKASSSLLPLVSGVVENFRAAGLTKTQSESLAATLVGNTLNGYFRGGRRMMLNLEKKSSAQSRTVRRSK